MIYILSFLGIIIEASLPFNSSVLIIAIPFFTYLVTLKRIRSVSCIFLMTVILSLQTHDFVRLFLIMAVFYYLFNFIFLNFVYSKENILSISIVQIGMYFIMVYKNYNLHYLMFNFIGFIIFNYLYVAIMRKKKNTKGQ
ncbi:MULTISPECIES: hypothetical protein [Fusobacterium]|jgi:hypothetical protein|uniref:Uncharacterized protein n=1 Tax=Fusobacterium varium ATCC 27725 TaxID=469618 RepID=A0ABM6U403_FUSVA|nr:MULTISPECIES: hypothetical protein [Fusobacterium]AVQ31018.1 hypothetical protein C4N18_07260 [Fusobacterium varium ATCC 27725]EES62336.1 hypothetical protein FVAG_00025 [Fusobacterium varium ATCC 27725]MCF0169641.1 hypothetical protein [Fusobacterium varium]MCF2673581.1 hypothetical protein [Fusobacterium varium]MCI6031637.1 hypothetical protein [Fusobacterium varium]